MELPLRDVRGRTRRCAGATAHPVVARHPRRRWPVVPRQRLAGPASADRGARPERVDGVRAPPIAGVLLTDAEIDHTAGLLLLRESATPVRVFGDAGVERALRDGYPVLRMLERYCGAEWETLEPGRAQRSPGRASTVEPFAAGGDAPRYVDGPDVELEASGFVFRDRATGGVLTYVPGLASLDEGVVARLAASDLVLVDGTFWREDELPRMGVTDRSARDMGHVPLSGPGGTLAAARRAGATAQGARAHQQHQPHPARGLARAARRSSGPASKSPTMASRPSCDDEFIARSARAGRALSRPAPVPPAHGRGRAHPRGAAALGREPLLLPEVHPAEGRGDPVELPRRRGPARVGPAHHRPRRHGRRDGRHRVVAAARRGARRLARGAGVRAAGAARGALRGRRLRELRAPEAVGRVRRVIAHRALRAGRDPRAARGARAALRVDRPRGARVLPRTARAGAARRAVRARPHRRALPDARAAGRRRGGAALQDRDAVGAARRHRARRHAAGRAGA